MNTGPLVSICMPAYNAEKYIAEAIRSVIAQTYTNWELIVVNDGSKDKTGEIAAQFANDPRIKIINQENSGQCAASNRAYLNAQGAFIKFLDADDLIAHNYLEEMLLHNTGADTMLFSQCVNFHKSPDQGIEYKKESWRELDPVDFLLHTSSNMRQGGRWLIPRAIIQKGGLWNESLSLINDYEYFTRLPLAARKIVYVPSAVLYYRQVPNSLSGQKSSKAYTSAFEAIRLAGKQLLSVENSPRVRARIANAYQDVLFNMYPSYPDLAKKFETEIKTLGGATVAPGGGKVTLVMNRLVGWKATQRIKWQLKKITGNAQA